MWYQPVLLRWRCKDWTPRTMAYELMSDHYNCLLDARCVHTCVHVCERARTFVLHMLECFCKRTVPQPSADIFGAGMGRSRKADTTLCTKRRLSRARSCAARGRCAVLRAFSAHHALYTSGTNLARTIHKRSVHTARGTLNVHRTLCSDACKIARLVASVFLARGTGCAERRLALAHRPGASTCCVPLIDI